ncbi:hypothetical protein ACA910_012110 [Epithemia clementina (nom. ined.)]
MYKKNCLTFVLVNLSVPCKKTPNWRTFDCVILVFDGCQGVNTEEQVSLLEFAKTQYESSKSVPIIVLLNKIDDPTFEEEQQLLVQEMMETVARIFDVSNQVKSLQEIVAGKAGSPATTMNHYSPIVIPISARNAYMYRVASSLTLDKFKDKIEEGMINKFGRNVFGHEWKVFDEHQKFSKALSVIQDEMRCKDGLEESKFDQFLTALSFCVGGTTTQEWLIGEQAKVYMNQLDPTLTILSP